MENKPKVLQQVFITDDPASQFNFTIPEGKDIFITIYNGILEKEVEKLGFILNNKWFIYDALEGTFLLKDYMVVKSWYKECTSEIEAKDAEIAELKAIVKDLLQSATDLDENGETKGSLIDTMELYNKAKEALR